MLQSVIELGILNFMAVTTPGPDFAVVVRNTLSYSRRTGIFTALGIATAVLVHISYCLLGLAVVLAKSHSALLIIGWAGGLYLIWLGIKALKSPATSPNIATGNFNHKPAVNNWIYDFQGFRQGFFTNLLNAKAIVFFIAMFSSFFTEPVSLGWGLIIAAELFLIVGGWFALLSWFLSRDLFRQSLQRLMPLIVKVMGVALIFFGAAVIIEIMLMKG